MLSILLACAATMQFSSTPPGAEVYVTDYLPNPDVKPASYESYAKTPGLCEVEYFAWETYYVWVGAEGYKPQVSELDGELKAGPAIGGFCFFPIWIWVWGPDDRAYEFKLEPATAGQVGGVVGGTAPVP